MANTEFDGIIIGAGGAGLMCALTAGQAGKRMLVIDHNDAPGKKILISGGGRCNFTNINTAPKNFLSNNPHFVKSALATYTQNDFLSLVEKHRIDWHEKTLGQLFCDKSAKQIVKMLMDECDAGKVEFALGYAVKTVTKSDHGYIVETDKGMFQAPNLVIATGGPSIPKLGASDFAYKLAKQFKLKLIEPRPALVPFTLAKDEALFSELSGVSTPTRTSNAKASFEEASLFTHKGLSGPAILQISSYWRHGEPITINFLPDQKNNWLIESKKTYPRSSVKTVLTKHLPERMASALCEKCNISEQNISDFKNTDLENIETQLREFEFWPNGTEGFAKAEVTVGGISTDELSSKTMESKKHKGLFFIGECVDVTGWLGGYNFQWAWSSGFASGTALSHQ